MLLLIIAFASASKKRELPVALIGGLLFGILGWSYLGGSLVMMHYSLRVLLWLSGYTPLAFVSFLDYCSRVVLLKKVGRGYIFIHRTLLYYFADLGAKTVRSEGDGPVLEVSTVRG